jgi:hypothetical protein
MKTGGWQRKKITLNLAIIRQQAAAQNQIHCFVADQAKPPQNPSWQCMQP